MKRSAESSPHSSSDVLPAQKRIKPEHKPSQPLPTVMGTPQANQYGLGEPAMLEKIDKLFACGVGELVDLPQIVVVGDQSSGKSSVLEGLIKKPLPRDSGLCTRFATQFVFRRATDSQISISIIPDPEASQEHSDKVKAWRKSGLTELDNATFSEIMVDVHRVMGLSGSTSDSTTSKKPTFSSDVLRLEISGPDQEHLSVIDVPGIFKNTTEGVTDKKDIQLVRNMVLGYMKNPRSVMLAVVPANVDVATQEIIELAREYDPDGDRTLGVLTKPDLVDKGAEGNVINIISGRARRMKLGWHLIRNPGQQDLADVSLDRGNLEMTFFKSTTPWNSIEKDKVGVESLRERLKDVLSGLVKREFPKVQQEIRKRLTDGQKRLHNMGPERADPAAQAAFLTTLAASFQRLVSQALAANYGANDLFEICHELRIAPLVTARMTAFSDDMAKWGESYSFRVETDNNPFTAKTLPSRKQEDIDELLDLLHPSQDLPAPIPGQISTWLTQIYQGNRGFELGTFNSTILATAMKKQSQKWTDLSLSFVSDVITLVHNFIICALECVCADRAVRNAISNVLSEGLISRYEQAISHTQFLLRVENAGTPITLNHYFNDNLQKSRQQRLTEALEKDSYNEQYTAKKVVALADVSKSQNFSNTEHTIQDIRDILHSYYKVSRKTFVDNVCKQATDHFLINGEDSPLMYFSPVFASKLSAADLEDIAGEPISSKRARAQLKKELASLMEARKILAKS